MSSSIARDPLRAEPERLDGARALDGLGERGVDLRVGRALAQVAVLGAGEVPPQPDHQRRHAEQARQRHPPADAERGDEGDDRGDDRDRPLRQRQPHRPAELVDVAAGAGQQVAGARPTRRRRPGSARVLSTKSSRSSASTCSPSTWLTGSARSGSARSAAPGSPASTSDDRGRRSRRWCRPRPPRTRSPSSRGAARAASAASDVQGQRRSRASAGGGARARRRSGARRGCRRPAGGPWAHRDCLADDAPSPGSVARG